MGNFLALVIRLLSRKLGEVLRLRIEGDLLLDQDLKESSEEDLDQELR